MATLPNAVFRLRTEVTAAIARRGNQVKIPSGMAPIMQPQLRTAVARATMPSFFVFDLLFLHSYLFGLGVERKPYVIQY